MAVYDPNKKYSWSPSDKFEMSGEQFGIILNAFRSVLGSPEAQRILFIQQANNVVEEIMANAVEANIVTEVIEEKMSKS